MIGGVAAAAAAPASADLYVINFSIDSLGSGTANVTTTGDASSGLTLVTALTGTFNGADISLLPAGTFPDFTTPANDNLFTSTSPFFDTAGLGFSADGISYDLYASNRTNLACSNADDFNHCGYAATVSVEGTSGVPEPATWAMMLFGFGAMGTMLRRRRFRQTAVPA